MKVNSDFKELLHHLNKENVKYLIVGAYAVIYHTEPRYTKDLDIWIATSPENAKQIYEALRQFGAPLDQVQVSDFSREGLVYQIGMEPNRIDILMGIQGIDFESAWKNKVEDFYGDERIYLMGLRDLIRAKEATGRPQDKIDAQSLKVRLKK